MTSRPTPLLLGISILALEGVAAIGWVVVAITVVFALAGGVLPVALAIIALGGVFGAACLVAAWGAWSARAWSWPVAVVLQALVVLSIVAAAFAGGWNLALGTGVAVGGFGLVGLLAPSTRRALLGR